MSEVLDLPAIEPEMIDKPAAPRTEVALASAAALDLAKVDLTDVALAQFGPWRKDVAAAVANIGTLALDLSNQARIDEAKTLRFRLIGQPRADIRKVSKELKSKLAKVSKAIGAEEEAAVLAYDEAEKPLTQQIDEAQAKLDAEKEAKRRAEEERLQALRDTVDGIMAKWLDRCGDEGMTPERIGAGIAALRDLEMPAEMADVQVYWTASHAGTITAMGKLQQQAVARAEAARLEAQRMENERIAAEQKRVAAEQAERQRLLDEKEAASLRGAKFVVAMSAAIDRCGIVRVSEVIPDTQGRTEELTSNELEEYTAALEALQPAAPVATAAAIEGKADHPEPGTLEAAAIQRSEEAPAHAMLERSPGLATQSLHPDTTSGAHASEPVNHEADAAPGWTGGAGLGEPVNAGGAMEVRHDDAGPAADITTDALRDRALDVIVLVREALESKFASQPKMPPEWWAALYAATDALAAASVVEC